MGNQHTRTIWRRFYPRNCLASFFCEIFAETLIFRCLLWYNIENVGVQPPGMGCAGFQGLWKSDRERVRVVAGLIRRILPEGIACQLQPCDVCASSVWGNKVVMNFYTTSLPDCFVVECVWWGSMWVNTISIAYVYNFEIYTCDLWNTNHTTKL